MYTWGYLKDATLAKLDLDESEAQEQDLLNRFPFYANEAMTQICSTVKPKHTYATFKVGNKDEVWNNLRAKYNVYSQYTSPIVKPSQVSYEENLFWNEYETYRFVNELVDMPSDFVAFDDDVNTREYYDYYNDKFIVECHDDDLTFKGYNQIIFKHVGTYMISYKARWFTFNKLISNDTVINAPDDVLDCLPSYMTHQCYKIDDEVKAQIYRNEYEIFMSRLDDTNYKQTKTFKIGGDW